MTVSRARVIPNSALADFCNKIDQEEKLMHRNVIRAKKRGRLAGGLSEETIECLAQAAVRLAFSTARRPAIASSTATLACSIDAMA